MGVIGCSRKGIKNERPKFFELCFTFLFNYLKTCLWFISLKVGKILEKPDLMEREQIISNFAEDQNAVDVTFKQMFAPN